MKKTMKVIRGKRIQDQLDLLEDVSVNDIEQKTKQFAPNTKKRQNAVGPVQVQKMELVPFGPSGALEVRGAINSSGKNYQSILMFSGLDYQQEDTNENVTFVGSDGEEHHIMPISLSAQNVKVRCTCLDFRWRFAMQHQQQGTLFGPGPEAYKTTSNRAPNNPNNIPGVCKHLLALASELKANSILR